MMPWVRLHCVKGYLDMVSVIEEFPGIRVNFNLTPVLLLQVKELVDGEIKDLWLDWSRKPAAELNDDEKFSLLENFFKINWDNLLKPEPRYWELLNKRGLTLYRDDVRRGLRYFTTQEFLDLQVWFNLAWCGYTAFRLYPELRELREKGRNFTEEEKGRVLAIHLEIMALVLRKYADAEARGQVELTTTPFYHPILPLVYDSAFAERSLPGRSFPKRFHWPQDAAAHLRLAVEQHAALFGRKPRGLWPSEGSIAPELIPLMQEAGIEYFCSDEENLFNSLKRDVTRQHSGIDHLELFQGWQVRSAGSSVNALFREKPLSDFIGFMAAKNDPEAAAAHLLHHLHQIADVVPRDTGLIPLMLDGENAWETFRDGGEAFLKALYGGILASPDRLHSCTIETYFKHHPPRREITTLHTGSWISSNFDIWIGEAEENKAWDLLGETRQFLQGRLDAGALKKKQEEAALQEIYAAEGSDWFWWYGPDFSTENDDLFDELFRQHLKNVYIICGDVPPANLDLAINRTRSTQVYEQPQNLISPKLTGSGGSYFDWIGAGSYTAGAEQGAMYRSERLLEKMLFGFDDTRLCLRLDLSRWAGISLAIHFSQPAGYIARTLALTTPGRQVFTIKRPRGKDLSRDTLVAGETIVWTLLLADLGVGEDAPVSFKAQILKDGIERESYPENDPIKLTAPSSEYALRNWIV